MTSPRWEVESFFGGFGGALFGLYCLLEIHSCRGCCQTCFGALWMSLVEHLSSLHFHSLRMKLTFDFLGIWLIGGV